jgi:hypothetical protein
VPLRRTLIVRGWCSIWPCRLIFGPEPNSQSLTSNDHPSFQPKQTKNRKKNHGSFQQRAVQSVRTEYGQCLEVSLTRATFQLISLFHLRGTPDLALKRHEVQAEKMDTLLRN